MPKRIIDGEALWRSDKLAQIEPTWIRAEFANLVPLAYSNGSFECNARLVWSRVYAYNRPEVSPEKVDEILTEFERVKLLFRWTAEGKSWGYWVGIEKPGRLPGPSRRGKNEQVGADVPESQLAIFLGVQLGLDTETSGIHQLPNGNENLLGSGNGNGSGSGGEAPEDSDYLIFQIAKAYPKLCHLRDQAEIPLAARNSIRAAILKDGAEPVLSGTKSYAASLSASDRKFTKNAASFFGEFQYRQFLRSGEADADRRSRRPDLIMQHLKGVGGKDDAAQEVKPA